MKPINEKTAARLTGQLVDETGAGVSAGSLSTLTLTLYDKLTGTIINGRNAQNVLNASNVTIDASGNVVWSMVAADNPILDDTLTLETHVALFQATWGTGKGANIEIEFQVRNIARVS